MKNQTWRSLLFLAVLSGILAATAQISRAQSNPQLDSEQWAFLTLINNYRAQNGLGALQVSAALQNASQWMSNDMAAKGYVSHTDSLGRTPGTRIAAFGYTYYPWGENIAAGYSDAQNTFEQWRTACDPDGAGVCTYAHRKNMLQPGFVVIGIGRAGGSSAYRWYWTTDFGGVVDSTITPGTPSAPVISAFTATPSTITAGQSTTLSWTVSGATTVSIDNGVGGVSGTSKSVTPAQTTTYKLTATNNSGSSTASVTVTVNAMNRDTQAPTVPVLSSAIARSSTQVDLAWSAATDNVGVAGYQIIRNGSVLTAITGGTLSYSDRTVSPSSSYTYSVKAFDAAGNYSATGNSVPVTTPAAQPSTNCPAPATNAFTGCYYNNTDLSGSPVLTRTDSQIQFDWGTGAPASSITPSNFSVRWQGNFTFEAAEYTFTSVASDGMRIYVDGQLILDRWRDQPPAMYFVRRTLTAGQHLITVEYYERTGSRTARLAWQRTGSPAAQTPAISSFIATPAVITLGQSTTLSWAVSGATTLSIDNGVGSVSGVSKAVTPAQTTTYKLTATNSAGSSTAAVTVTVNTMNRDTQAPTIPVLSSAIARSATQVDLAWSAATDNVSVAGYQIIRNGTVLTAVSNTARSYSDRSVSASSSYTYSVKAFDAAGNYSAASKSVQVTTPAAQASTNCPAPATNAFTGCYYNNTDLSGSPVLTRTDNQIQFDWGTGTPASSITPYNFSARWQGYFNFEASEYTFTTVASDGMRIYVDGQVILDRWRDQPAYMYSVRRTITAGQHLVKVEYYERTGLPTARVSWQKSLR